jgi:hypothetical protein
VTSSFTPNKDLEMPASGDYDNAWAAPLNAVIDECDTAFGGVTSIDVTGFGAETLALTVTQYRPPNLEFYGTISGQLLVTIPAGVGGFWSVSNSTSGAFNLYFANASNTPILIIQGQRSFVISDGVNMVFADSVQSAIAVSAAEAFATAADAVVTTNTEAFATAADSVVLSTAETFSSNASNLTAGAVANARLPNPGVGPGVTIAADPGTTPSGPPGSIWYYY